MGAYTLTDKQQVNANLETVLRAFPAQGSSKQCGHPLRGDQQMLATGRALMAILRFVMEEPSMGLSHRSRDLRIINLSDDRGITILLVEQTPRSALSYPAVLCPGNRAISMSGSAQELMEDDSVRKAY